MKEAKIGITKPLKDAFEVFVFIACRTFRCLCMDIR